MGIGIGKGIGIYGGIAFMVRVRVTGYGGGGYKTSDKP